MTNGETMLVNSSPDVQERIYSFARRVVRLMGEISDIRDGQIKPLQEDIKEVVAEAKGNGFDTKMIRAVAKKLYELEHADRDDYEEAAVLMKLYWDAVMAGLRKDGKYVPPEGDDDDE